MKIPMLGVDVFPIQKGFLFRGQPRPFLRGVNLELKWRCEQNILESKRFELNIGDKWIEPKPGSQGALDGSVTKGCQITIFLSVFFRHPFEGRGVILFFFFRDTVQLTSLFYIL